MATQKKYNKPYNNSSDNRGGNDNRSNNNNRNSDNRNNNSQNQPGKPPAASGAKPKSQSKSESSHDLIIFIVFLVALALFFLVKTFYLPPAPIPFYGNTNNIEFMKEGKLSFESAQSGFAIADIFIEVAKSEQEITQGLMYRKALPANAGMLFIFDSEDIQSFWMKNTFLSLDIIFVNAKMEIVKIHKNAAPLSEVNVSSDREAQFVVEVLAGFTDAHDIHVGDRVAFNY